CPRAERHLSDHLHPSRRQTRWLHTYHRVVIPRRILKFAAALGDLDLALISRDHPWRGALLFHEPMVWVGSPMEVAVYQSRASRGSKAVDSLQGLLVRAPRLSAGD